MAGLAPFGRDDQPFFDVKIVGGKRVEVEVDKYGNPLKQERSTHLPGTQQRVSPSAISSRASVPPWVNRGDTPPRKLLKSLESPEDGSHNSAQGLRRFSSPSSHAVLPPIKKSLNSGVDDESKTKSLASRLNSVLLGFDTLRLKDAYLSFAGFDSTLSGFVSAEQIEREFFRLQIPVRGELLKELLALFMSAHRPNWVNYEQLLKFLNNAVQPAPTKEFRVPKLDLTSNPGDRLQEKISAKSPREKNLPLKPNQVSPRADESQKGRQSAIAVRKAFQDKQDTAILLQMEEMLKEVGNAQEQIHTLRRALEEQDVARAEVISTQKLKTICLHHHIPFHNSLLDKIIDRLDRYNSGRVSWFEFISFIERALPLPSPSVASSPSPSRNSRHGLETPPTRPVWETRQPLKGVNKGGQDGLQVDMLQGQLQSLDQEGSVVGDRQQQDSYQCHKTAPMHQVSDERGGDDFNMSLYAEDERRQLEDRREDLLRKQRELIEQKRQIQREQEEINQFIQHQKEKLYAEDHDYEPSHYVQKESKVERFMKLANALYVCDQDQSGLIEADIARRLLNNYNLVNQLDFSAQLIENTIKSCSTTDDKVSVDDLIDELKSHL